MRLTKRLMLLAVTAAILAGCGSTPSGQTTADAAGGADVRLDAGFGQPDVAPDLALPEVGGTDLVVAVDLAPELSPPREIVEPPDTGAALPDAPAPDAMQEAPCGEGDDEKIPRAAAAPVRIVNGQASHDAEVVALSEGQILSIGALYAYRRSWSGQWSWDSICTGTLVSEDVVLTAAHCVVNIARADHLEFRIGRDSARPQASFRGRDFAYHPRYEDNANAGDAAHDIAYVVLAEDVVAAVRGISPIRMNTETLPAHFLGAMVQSVGYGATSTSPWAEDNTERWWTVEEVTEVTDFDFVVYGFGESSVCWGDSGGPSLWTFPDGVVRVAGVVSWGDPSCVDYDHYARVDHSADWLREALNPQDDCEGESHEGRCQGQVAIWCGGEPEAVQRADCAAQGWTCGDDGRGRMRCLPGDCGAALSWLGSCLEGQVAVWCEEGEIRKRRCAPCGQICATRPETGLGSYCY